MTAFSDWSRWLKPRLAIPLITLNGWVILKIVDYLDPFFTIFVLASVLAFVLDYPVWFLQQRGMRRGYAVLLVIVASLVALAALGVTLVPILAGQLTEIATSLPNWIDSASQKLQVLEAWATSRRFPIDLSQVLAQIPDRLPAELQTIADQSLTYLLDAVDSLADVLLTVVLSFYLLLDGQHVWEGMFQRLPLPDRQQLRQTLEENFHRYFVGQLTLATLMGSLLSVAFFVLHVPYSLVLGLSVGLLTLIPFGDTVSLILISLVVMTQDTGLGVRTLAVAIVIDQVVDQAIAPRVLGRFTGLSPIWVLLALLLGTKIAGLAGLLTAVPIASFINILLTQDTNQTAALALNTESAIPEHATFPISTTEAESELESSTEPVQR